MAEKIQAIRGMNDILPDTSHQWLFFEHTVREWLKDYGYKNIRTPIVEDTRLFVRSIGEATDIVEKEMYTFTDSLNGDSLTLRPEGTASCLRAALQHNLLYKQTQRLWYIGPMFRHERPQKGRYRQFHQIGAEALGFSGPDVDAEIVIMLADLWQRLRLTPYLQLQINTLGSSEERAAHRQALIAYLEQHQDALDEDGKRRLYTNPLRVLDSKTPSMQAICEQAPRLLDYLGDASRQHYDEWRQMIRDANIPYVENPRLVRGLDYYNLSVFEWVTQELGAQGTVCGGGRYDGLIEQLGGQATPAVGFAMGVERLMLLLGEKNLLPAADVPDWFVIHQGEGTARYALRVAQQLRQAGLRVVQHMGEASFKSQMKKADASGAYGAVIIGANEVTENNVVLKPLHGGLAQQTVPFAEVATTARTLLQQIQAQKETD